MLALLVHPHFQVFIFMHFIRLKAKILPIIKKYLPLSQNVFKTYVMKNLFRECLKEEIGVLTINHYHLTINY